MYAIPVAVRTAPHFSHPLFSSSAICLLLTKRQSRPHQCPRFHGERSLLCCNRYIYKFLRNLWLVLTTEITSLRPLVLEDFSALPPRFPANSCRLAHEIWILDDLRSVFLR